MKQIFQQLIKELILIKTETSSFLNNIFIIYPPQFRFIPSQPPSSLVPLLSDPYLSLFGHPTALDIV